MTNLNEICNIEIAQLLAENNDKLNNAKINYIHPDIDIKYSSINILCGKQGKGKSLTIFKELVKLSKIHNNVHLFIYVTKNGRIDETLEAIKPLISIPCVYVSVNEIEDYLNNLYFHKLIYDKIINEWKDKQLEEEQINEVLEFLHLNDFSLPMLLCSKINSLYKVISRVNNFVNISYTFSLL